MPATTADITASSRRARIEAWSDAAVQTRYPNARDGQTDPAEGFFDNAADGATAIAARAALLGTDRRRFTAIAHDLVWSDLESGFPIVKLIDPEQAINGNTLPARIALSLEAETTAYEVIG
ncbi:MAG TPA: hypothetical protein VGO55_03235 [Allosphingosinicella sp.]|jgi:hypothetical protein|nr:hypothetical protein [Allosphingosinicella sp.]